MWFSGTAAADRTAIATRLRRRDPELLDLLIEQYEYRLFRYLMCLTANRAVAEDLFQETWIRVLDRGDQYNAASSFEGWLFGIARHLAIDYQRRRKWESLDDGAELIATAAASAEAEMARQEQSAEVRDALGRLPAIHREVLLLRFQEDLPLAEIAAVIDAPVSTVKSRLYRAMEALRQEMEHA